MIHSSVKTRNSAAALQAFRTLHRSKEPPLNPSLQTSEAANWDDDGGQGATALQGDAVRAIRSTFVFRWVLGNRVSVVERQGEVVLAGDVQDSFEYWLAEYTAAYCLGVARVTNQLVVRALHRNGSDRWIEFSLLRALLMKANIAQGAVSVRAKDGAVDLEGTVKNLARRGLVEACAWEIPGAHSVRNSITLDERAGESSAKRDDASIVGQVRCALRLNPLTRSLNAKVSSNDGFLVVIGIAASEAERNQVASIAFNVIGVKSVTNSVFVKC